MSGPWLLDKSAYERFRHSDQLLHLWLERINRGFVHVTSLTLLEMGFSARNGRDWTTAMRNPPVANLLVEYLTPVIEDRAVEVQGLLAEQGQHRGPSIPDLLIAAVAEINGLTVAHDDKDFDLIAEITGQPLERLSTGKPHRDTASRGRRDAE